MRSTQLLRAALRGGARFLEPNQPTGLTGLRTHKSPRAALLSIYSSTLDKLQQLPESSVYRQSVEALTKHRLSIVESVKPEGHDAWQDKVRQVVEANPEAFSVGRSRQNPKEITFVENLVIEKPDEKAIGEDNTVGGLVDQIGEEPQLSIEQIGDIESKIAAGLVEEVLQVAQGEHVLVDTMVQEQVWDELVEKAAPGQWVYHERDTHVPKTQAP